MNALFIRKASTIAHPIGISRRFEYGRPNVWTHPRLSDDPRPL